jgi:hypothetical protein
MTPALYSFITYNTTPSEPVKNIETALQNLNIRDENST